MTSDERWMIRTLYGTRARGGLSCVWFAVLAAACFALASHFDRRPISIVPAGACLCFVMLAYLGLWRGLGLNESGDHLLPPRG